VGGHLTPIPDGGPVLQPAPSFIHLPRGLVPQFAPSINSGYCCPSPFLADLLQHRNKIILKSLNPFCLP
jgi:hypothetical protein